jgi:hypothetical protein
MSMATTIDYTATEARTKLFEILNSVYFGDTEVRIIKNRKPMVRIIKEFYSSEKKDDFLRLFGSLSGDTACAMEREIKKLKKTPSRNELLSA